MFRFHSWRLGCFAFAATSVNLLVAPAVLGQSDYTTIGRAATAKEVAAWDIDVRPDFKGLPKGSGSVAQGMVLWESKCASCHGVFGESNQFFSPLVGGTTAHDIQTGHVARLKDSAYPGRTTLMKVSTLSTLWDYINRAMPWNAPKSLSVNEVYAVTAYLLNLGGIVPDNLVLSDANMADVQKLMPNRNGTTTDHGLWPGKLMGNGGKPDVKAIACMKNCAVDVKVTSFLPDFASNAHGNLAEQNRSIGAQHGMYTARSSAANSSDTKSPATLAADEKSGNAAAIALTQKYACVTCHGMDKKIVGPGFKEVANKYAQRTDAVGYLAGKIRSGGSGVWGPILMPSQSLSDADAQTIAQWLASGANK